jgi:hypothetical protein
MPRMAVSSSAVRVSRILVLLVVLVHKDRLVVVVLVEAAVIVPQEAAVMAVDGATVQTVLQVV